MPGILVVEDDENLNRGITFSLKKSGYEVFSAESVKKAKRIASDHNVDVTICDVNLPDGNGLEFVRWMRCNYNTYIICLTALDQEMDQVIIWLGVSLLGPHVAFAVANGKLWAMGVKLFSQVIVIVSNYVFSKLFIFKKK